MTLTVEDGTGIAGADSYASLVFLIAYWTARPHDPLGVAFLAAAETKQEGAAREATIYMDATFGPSYRGQRRGYVQGRLFPRTGALDDANYPLPDLPDCLAEAQAELAGRAITKRLAKDAAQGGRVKRVKIAGAGEREFFEGAPAETLYGSVAGILDPVLDGTQSGAKDNHWGWA